MELSYPCDQRCTATCVFALRYRVEMSDLVGEATADSESLDDLFCEIWERESKTELRFDVKGAGTVRCCAVCCYLYAVTVLGHDVCCWITLCAWSNPNAAVEDAYCSGEVLLLL